MNKFRFIIFIGTLMLSGYLRAQNTEQEIRLIVRGDDIGFCHSANLGCIDAYKNGIMRSVEIMVPCPWFPEAVKILRENPGLDVGIHLTLTSEWENLKWGPVSCAPSLTDKNGYFYPMIWKNNVLPQGSFLKEANWNPEEIEKEFRAQIELALKNIPQVSHLSSHMGCLDMDPKVKEICERLAKEYKLDIETGDHAVKYAKGWGRAKSLDEKINAFSEMLENLGPGTWLFIEHPAIDSPEMEAIEHSGNSTVGRDRDMVVKVFCDEKVKNIIKRRGIRLISYKDLIGR